MKQDPPGGIGGSPGVSPGPRSVAALRSREARLRGQRLRPRPDVRGAALPGAGHRGRVRLGMPVHRRLTSAERRKDPGPTGDAVREGESAAAHPDRPRSRSRRGGREKAASEGGMEDPHYRTWLPLGVGRRGVAERQAPGREPKEGDRLHAQAGEGLDPAGTAALHHGAAPRLFRLPSTGSRRGGAHGFPAPGLRPSAGHPWR